MAVEYIAGGTYAFFDTDFGGTLTVPSGAQGGDTLVVIGRGSLYTTGPFPYAEAEGWRREYNTPTPLPGGELRDVIGILSRVLPDPVPASYQLTAQGSSIGESGIDVVVRLYRGVDPSDAMTTPLERRYSSDPGIAMPPGVERGLDPATPSTRSVIAINLPTLLLVVLSAFDIAGSGYQNKLIVTGGNSTTATADVPIAANPGGSFNGTAPTNTGQWETVAVALNPGSSLPKTDPFNYRASDDITQPWNDIDSRLELGFNETIEANEVIQLPDVRGQIIATGRPIEPSIAQGRTSYALQSLLSRLDTEAILSRSFVLNGPFTPQTFVSALLTYAKTDYPWIEWEPIPVISLQTSRGILEPRIKVLQYTADSKAENWDSVLSLIKKFLAAFEGYDYGVTPANRLEIRSPYWAAPASAPDLTVDDVNDNGITPLNPRYKPANAVRVGSTPWEYTPEQPLIEASAIRIVPGYWRTDPDLAGVGNPYNEPDPAVGAWPPTKGDAQGSPAAYKEVGRGVINIAQSDPSPYTYTFPDFEQTFFVPFAANTLVDPNSPATLTLSWKHWGLRRNDAAPAAPAVLAADPVVLPASGAEVLVKDWSDFRAGLLAVNRTLILRVWASLVATGVNVRILINPTVFDFTGKAIDFGSVFLLGLTGSKWSKGNRQLEVGFGFPGPDQAEAFSRIPELAAHQQQYGIVAAPPVSIDFWSLAEDQGDAITRLRDIAENLVRRYLNPPRRFRFELGFGKYTPFDVMKTVQSFVGDSRLGVITRVDTSGAALPQSIASSLTLEIEEIARIGPPPTPPGSGGNLFALAGFQATNPSPVVWTPAYAGEGLPQAGDRLLMGLILTDSGDVSGFAAPSGTAERGRIPFTVSVGATTHNGVFVLLEATLPDPVAPITFSLPSGVSSTPEWTMSGVAVRGAASLSLAVQPASGPSPLALPEYTPGNYAVYELVLAALSAPNWLGLNVDGAWEKTATSVNTKNLVGAWARYAARAQSLGDRAVTASTQDGPVSAYAFRAALTDSTPPPPPPSASNPILYAPRNDKGIHTSSLSTGLIASINALPVDAVLITVDGYTYNGSGTQGLRSPRSALIDLNALKAEMEKAAGITKLKCFFYLTDYPDPDPAGGGAARARSIQNMATVARACADLGWYAIVEDNEQYEHDGYVLTQADYYNYGWGIRWAGRFAAAKAYFKEMVGAMLTAWPAMYYGMYHGPYAGVKTTQGWLLEGQIGNDYKGYLAFYAGGLEAIVDAGRVGSAYLDDMFEQYGYPAVSPGKSWVDAYNYRSQGILPGISTLELGDGYKAQWAQVIKFGWGRSQKANISAPAVRQELTEMAPYTTGIRWYYAEAKPGGVTTAYAWVPTPEGNSQNYIDGIAAYRAP